MNYFHIACHKLPDLYRFLSPKYLSKIDLKCLADTHMKIAVVWEIDIDKDIGGGGE